MALYEKVKRECERSGMSVLELERLCEFPRSSICKWNTNKPSIEKVKKVADKLNISIDHLLAE